jgi:hypothetical protein
MDPESGGNELRTEVWKWLTFGHVVPVAGG